MSVLVGHLLPQRRPAGDRTWLAQLTIGLLILALAAISALCLAWGASDASLMKLVLSLAGIESFGSDMQFQRDLIIIRDIRVPRIVLGGLIGASLAASGAVMQGLFRNPLADPGLVGVSAGAGLGAATAIIIGGPLVAAASISLFMLPLSAFCGSLIVTLTLYALATRRGLTSVATMLLAGIALGAMAGAFTGLLVYIADDGQLRELTFWLLGSLAGATWTKVLASGPIIFAALLVMPFLARSLNAFALGESGAHHLGIPVQRAKSVAVVTVAAATGSAVAVSGGIGFVGIVVPHLLRLAIGPDHRFLLPASALLGACLLLLADALSRTIVAPAELPIGIVTAAIGAPFFLWLLLRKRGLIDL